jgi:hypothetical protein
MNLVTLIEFLRNRLKTVVMLCCVGLGIVVLLDAIPAIVNKEHAHTSIEHWPGFWAVFGFVACVVILIASKWFGHAGIMVNEDYYDQALPDLNSSESAVAEHGHATKEHHD